MASTKIYTVMKDGNPIRELKTLTAARKLADAEGAEVFCDGKAVYNGAADAGVKGCIQATEGSSETPVIETVTLDRYRLMHLMNVRSAPSMEAKKLSTLPAGTEVSVLEVVNDWLRLADDTFILFGGGKFAEKL